MRSDAVDAHHAERGGQGQVRFFDAALDCASVNDDVVLPAEHARHHRADGQGRIVGLLTRPAANARITAPTGTGSE